MSESRYSDFHPVQDLPLVFQSIPKSTRKLLWEGKECAMPKMFEFIFPLVDMIRERVTVISDSKNEHGILEDIWIAKSKVSMCLLGKALIAIHR